MWGCSTPQLPAGGSPDQAKRGREPPLAEFLGEVTVAQPHRRGSLTHRSPCICNSPLRLATVQNQPIPDQHPRTLFRLSHPFLNNARQTRRPRHARGRLGSLSLLHHLDTIDALRRLRPPAPEFLPAARLGDPHSRHLDPARQRRGRFLPQRRHDSQQPEEGRQGQGGARQEEGVKEERTVCVCVCVCVVGRVVEINIISIFRNCRRKWRRKRRMEEERYRAFVLLRNMFCRFSMVLVRVGRVGKGKR